MEFFVVIAAKSLLVAAAALLLLKLAEKRSASQRSWIAHLGLAAILMLPVAALLLPNLEVRGPDFLTPAPAETSAAAPAAAESAATANATATEAATPADSFPVAGTAEAASAVDWPLWLYAAPAALLLLLTLIALGRLFTLRTRANVLVEPHWLAALAHAQRRMGFKHGTALLTSDELPSPISWGLMRPVILLNSEATDSPAEAEAIIAHELAHVASLDWAKLLLSRVTVALFWFNPLVWLLAREAHQLREEAADDAVLGADIEDTDYARLLVGVARHECRGLLIGAHGVAPGRNSLSRRVRRVLDSGSVRGPVGRAFALGVFAGAAMLAAPLAAVTLTAPPPDALPMTAAVQPKGPAARAVTSRPGDAAIESAVEAALVAAAEAHPQAEWTEAQERELDARLERIKARAAQAGSRPPSSAEINAAVASAVSATAIAGRVDRAVTASVHGVTPAFAAEMRALSRDLSRIGPGDLTDFKVHGVTPAFVRELEASGLRGLTPSQLTTAAIHGVNGKYLRSMAAAGYPNLSYNQAVNMRIHGVTPDYVRALKRQGFRNLSASQLLDMRILGPGPDELEEPDIDLDIDLDHDRGP